MKRTFKCNPDKNTNSYNSLGRSLKDKGRRKLSVFKNDCFRNIVGVFRMNDIQMIDISNLE